MKPIPKPLISFVVPAYNAQSTLAHTLQSIYALHTHGAARQVIVVNDGSTDDTERVIRQVKTKHPRLIVITQTNQGLSAARNAGMLRAEGRYIYFVDADDVLDATAPTTQLIHTLRHGNYDIVGVDLVRRTPNGQAKPYRRYVPPYGQEFCPAMQFLAERNIMPCVGAYFFARELCTQLSFAPGLYHEDEDFTPRAFLLARHFVALRIALYVYIQRPQSITTTTCRATQQKRLHHMLHILEGLQGLATHNPAYAQALACKVNYLATDTLRLLLRQCHAATFRHSVVRRLRHMGLFPLPWRAEPKHTVFNLFTRLLFIFIR